MPGARWAALAVLAAIGVAGCGGSDSGPKGTDIAVITPGKRDDADWTRQLSVAARQVAARYHVRARVVDGSAAGGIQAALERVKDSAQLVVVPFSADRAAATRFARTTQIPTLVWGDPAAVQRGLVGDVQLAAGQGTYAAGIVAAHASIFKSVGIVVCDDVPAADLEARYNMAAAFVAGARTEDPKVKVAYARAGDHGTADAAAAKAATLKITVHGPLIHSGPDLAEPGAQMVLSLCGSATPGVMQGIERADGESQFVGIVGDKAPINKQNMVLTSSMWNAAPVLAQAMKDIRAGAFGGKPYPLDFANGGIELLSTGRTPGDALEAGNGAKDRLQRKLVGLPDTTTESDLEAYVAG